VAGAAPRGEGVLSDRIVPFGDRRSGRAALAASQPARRPPCDLRGISPLPWICARSEPQSVTRHRCSKPDDFYRARIRAPGQPDGLAAPVRARLLRGPGVFATDRSMRWATPLRTSSHGRAELTTRLLRTTAGARLAPGLAHHPRESRSADRRAASLALIHSWPTTGRVLNQNGFYFPWAGSKRRSDQSAGSACRRLRPAACRGTVSL
jgi:hypothetical protein